MAVDTVKKRASVLGIVWPDANGIDQADRQTILGVYGGVLAGELAVASGLISIAITGARPSAAVTGSKPNVAITGSRIGVSVTGDGG